MPRIVVSVSNDLVTDQRVRKVCQTLFDNGYDIYLIGRKLPDSLTMDRPYKVHRMNLFFRKKVWFYAELNIRLFFKLLFTKKDILLANDLDTLLPNYIISKIFRKKLVYDSHEFFTEIPELIHRPQVQNVWLNIEKYIFPKLKNVITVNHKIASIYHEKYNVPVHIIRNISPKIEKRNIDSDKKNQMANGKKILILQGSGINRDRGVEEAVTMMQHVDIAVLIIIGSGEVIPDLKKFCKEKKLENKVKFIGKLPYPELIEYTQMADLGLSLDKGTNLNYEYSLPNKIFDYIQCNVPLMVSNRRLVAEIVKQHQIGFVFYDHNPIEMAKLVNNALTDEIQYEKWKKNLQEIASIYTWENESKKLLDIYQNLK